MDAYLSILSIFSRNPTLRVEDGRLNQGVKAGCYEALGVYRDVSLVVFLKKRNQKVFDISSIPRFFDLAKVSVKRVQYSSSLSYRQELCVDRYEDMTLHID